MALKNLTPLKFALKATGVREIGDPKRSGIHSRGYLPHIKREGSSYFVTFRLADSLPAIVLRQFEQQIANGSDDKSKETVNDPKQQHRRLIERYLDTGAGACHLGKPEIADLVSKALLFWNGSRYDLVEWVIMPNHVHVVVRPATGFTLSAILHSWKRFTARQANRMLGRTGSDFWQPEAFDRWIRNDEEKAKICAYIRRNPVKAGLCAEDFEWRWSSAFSPLGEGGGLQTRGTAD